MEQFPSIMMNDIRNISKHIKKLSKCVGPHKLTGFDYEFYYIEKESMKAEYNLPCSDSQAEENRNKNRYSNVLPYDETRVILRTKPDYINANYINTFQGYKYIATQGPLSSTIYDFWRMVWELEVSTIVMLTREYESGRMKCVKYWPSEGEALYKDLMISVIEIDSGTDIICTKISLRMVPTSEIREVIHYQHVEWPDHGLPQSTDSFLKLISQIEPTEQKGPIVVHCSAGIGRSEKNGSFPPINIVSTVLNMRKQRKGMVQTGEQYVFCYFAIYQAYKNLKKNHQLVNK